MPHVVNGIGTWYWGRRSAQSRMGTCESCHRYGELKSYDTTLYFVILFLPVIPLGKKHIIDECPSCKRHRVISLGQYQEAREKDLNAAIKAMKDAPEDADKATKALRIMLAYEDRANFEALAPALIKLFFNNKDLLVQAAEGYMFFGKHAEAEIVWRQVLSLQDAPEFRQRLAVSIIRQFRPNEAEPLLTHVLDNKQKDKVGLLYFLVEGYQSTGAHVQALSILDRIITAWPELTKDKEYRKYRKISERHKESGKAVSSALLAAPKVRGEGRDWTGFLAKVFLPIAAAVVLVVYVAWSFAAGRAREVWLVNGTARQYSVLINGREFSVKGGTHVTISLAEGAWQMAPGRNAAGIEPATVTFNTSFFLRPFKTPTLILNPDRVAVIINEASIYSAHPDANASNPYSTHCGLVFYEFADIDYPFQDFPSQVSLPSSTSQITKRRVSAAHLGDSYTIIPWLEKELGRNSCIDYLARRAQLEPETSVWINALYSMAPAERTLKLVRGKLGQRPVLVDWHRAYQSLMERDPSYDLVAEYRDMAAKEPQNPYLCYLLGRAMNSQAEAEKKFAEAETCGAKPIGYGYHAIAYYRLCSGSFAEAAELERKAMAARPESLEFDASWGTAAEGAGQYAELLADVRAKRAKAKVNATLVLNEYTWLFLLGRSGEAEDVWRQYQKEQSKNIRADTMKSLRLVFQATAAYLSGRTDDYLRVVEQMKAPGWLFAAAITRGDATGAAKQIEKIENATYTDHLLVYAAAKTGGNEELAGHEWKAALELAKKDDNVDRRIKKLFAGEKPDTQSLLEAHIFPEQKRIVLMAFGLACPESQTALFAKAGQLNVHVNFPQAFITKILSSKK